MQCLYCKKKLGLFASKKRPFCTEQHEVAYNDEQAGLAMRRVMDPLFTEPVPKAPLQPRNGSADAEAAPVTAAPSAPPPTPLPIPASRLAAPPAPLAQAPIQHAPAYQPPAAQSFVRQPGPLPYPPEPGGSRMLFEFELSAVQAQLPSSGGSVIEFEEEIEIVPDSSENWPTASPRLHPALEQETPDWLTEEPDVTPRNGAAPMGFGDVSKNFAPALPALHAGPVSEPAFAGEPAATPEPPPSARLPWPAALSPLPRKDSHAGRSAPGIELDSPPAALRYPFAELMPAVHEAYSADVDARTFAETADAIAPAELAPDTVDVELTSDTAPHEELAAVAEAVDVNAPAELVPEAVDVEPPSDTAPRVELAAVAEAVDIELASDTTPRAELGAVAEAVDVNAPANLAPEAVDVELASDTAPHPELAAVAEAVDGNTLADLVPEAVDIELASDTAPHAELAAVAEAVDVNAPVDLAPEAVDVEPASDTAPHAELAAVAEAVDVNTPVELASDIAPSEEPAPDAAAAAFVIAPAEFIPDPAPDWKAEPARIEALDAAPITPRPLPRPGPVLEEGLPEIDAAKLGAPVMSAFLEPRLVPEPHRRWKVFSSLRERPAKLNLPTPPGEGRGASLTPLPTERLEWSTPEFPPAGAELASRELRLAAWAMGLSVPGELLSQPNTVVASQPVGRLPWTVQDCPPRVSLVASEEILPCAPAVGLAIRREALEPRQRVVGNKLWGSDGIRQPDWKVERPASPVQAREDVAQLDRILIPAAPRDAEAPPARSVRKAAPAQLLRLVHFDRRRRYRPSSLVANSLGFQRVRAAAYIQIREPELRQANPNGGFAASVKLPWHEVRMKREVQPAALPVRLRPAVHTPQWAA